MLSSFTVFAEGEGELGGEYIITGYKNRGTDDLVLTLPDDKAGENVQKVEAEGAELNFTQEGDKLTVKRYDFRGAVDLYPLCTEQGYVDVKVTLSGDEVLTYKITLSAYKYEVGEDFANVKKSSFKSDEIIPDNSWSVVTSSENGAHIHANLISGQESDYPFWHSGYTQDPSVIGDSRYYYIDIDMGEARSFSGIRYLSRKDNTSGNLKVLLIYGRTSETGEWTDFGGTSSIPSLTQGGTHDVMMNEVREARYIRLKVSSSTDANAVHTTAAVAGFRILKPKASLIGDSEITVDTDDTLIADEELKIRMYTATDVESVSTTDGELTEGTDYTFDTDTLTLKKEFIETLPEGESEITVTLDTEETLSITINKVNTLVGEYVVNGYGLKGTNELVLTLPRLKAEKEVTKIEAEGAELPFMQSGATLTVKRYDFRGSFDIHVLCETQGYVNVKVTLADDAVLTYKVTLKGGYMYQVGKDGATVIASSFKSDEIIPDNTWSAGASSDSAGRVIAKLIVGQKCTDLFWESGYTVEEKKVIGDSNYYYIDIDMGEARKLGGIRYLSRIKSKSPLKVLLVYGRSSSADEWQYLGGSDNLTAIDKESSLDVLLDSVASVRYIRLKISADMKSSRSTATLAGIRILKPAVSVKGEATVKADKNEALTEDAVFSFNMGEATDIDSVKSGDTTLTKGTHFSFESGSLTIKKEYIKTLPEGETELTVKFDTNEELKVTINRTNTLTAEYTLTVKEGVGDNELKLKLPAGKSAEKVAIGDAELDFTSEDGYVTVMRHVFRNAFDTYEQMKTKGFVNVDVTTSDGTALTYEVTLKGYRYVMAEREIYTQNFKKDEIIPDSTWTIELSSTGQASDLRRLINGLREDGGTWFDTYWTCGYSKVDGKVVGDTQDPNYSYFEIGMDKAYEIAGIRYYTRIKDKSGYPKSVSIWVRSSEDEAWTLAGEDIEVADIEKAGDAIDIFLTEKVTAKYIKLKAVSRHNTATAVGIHVLKPSVGVIGESTKTTDKREELASNVSFGIRMGNAKEIVSVKAGEDALNCGKDYSFENGKLNFLKDYVSELPEGKTDFTVLFDTDESLSLTIDKTDTLVATYILSAKQNRGDNELELKLPEGRSAKGVKIGTKIVDFSKTEGGIKILRYNFRGAFDSYEAMKTDGFVTVTVTLSDETVLDYRVELTGYKYVMEDKKIQTANFKSDEIVPDASWGIEVSSSTDSGDMRNLISGDTTETQFLHSGYTGVGGVAMADTEYPKYIEIDMGKETLFSGIRYLTRVDNKTGAPSAMSIYGRNDENDEWVLLKRAEELNWDKNTSNDVTLPYTARCRYIKLSLEGTHIAAAGIRIIYNKKAFVNAKITEESVPLDSELGRDAVIKAELNGGGKITGVFIGDDRLPDEYVAYSDDTVKISYLYFEHKGYKKGDTPTVKLTFAFGESDECRVNVGEASGNSFTYKSLGNGKITAVTENSTLGKSEISSGSKARGEDKLIFTAVPDTGYEVDQWTVKATTPVYEVVNNRDKWTVKDESVWKKTYPDAKGCGWTNALDGNEDTYWHSWYNMESGKIVAYEEAPFTVTFKFPGEIKNAAAFAFTPRNDSHMSVGKYELLGSTDGENFFTLAEGEYTSHKEDWEHFIEFTPQDLRAVKFIIKSTLGGKAGHIAEVNMYTARVPSGRVTYKGASSESFEIDKRFTDMEVSVSFKKITAGTVNIGYSVSNITHDGAKKVNKGEDVKINMIAASGYSIPDDVLLLTADGERLKKDSEYTYEKKDGQNATLTVFNLSRSISVIAQGKAAGLLSLSYADISGASGSLPAAQYLNEGDSVKIKNSELSLSGYTFSGWTVYSEASENAEAYKSGDNFIMKKSDVVLIAVWKKASSRPGGSVGSGGGGGASASIAEPENKDAVTVKKGERVTEPDEREGYEFLGYYRDKAYTVPYNNEEITEDTVLYALWGEAKEAGLSDIKGHWAEEYIKVLHKKAMVSGTPEGKFMPDDSITRAEFVQILYNMLKMQVSDTSELEDVSEEDWFFNAVMWAFSAGIVKGRSDNVFAPYEKITRQEMAVMIARYLEYRGESIEGGLADNFTDSADIASWAKKEVGFMAQKGIIKGRENGDFAPLDNATRAEAAAMIYRFTQI